MAATGLAARELLELQHDGRIPPDARRDPMGNDLRRWFGLPALPDPHCRIGRIALKPTGIIEAMARELLRVTRGDAGATAADLKRAGWSADEIALYADEAVARARRLEREREVRS